ncbi:MAG: LysM peptidoglycan-binding domain-containing protein [Thiohalocapsa sp.]
MAARIATALAAAGISLCSTALAQPVEQANPPTQVSPPPAIIPADTAAPQVARDQELAQLRRENTELRARLQTAAQIPAPTEDRVERTEAELGAARAMIDQLNQQRQTDARHHTAQLTAAELRLREHKDRLMGLETRIQALQAEIQARDAEIAVLTARLDASNDNESRLSQRVTALRGRLTANEGGTLTAADARKQAEADAQQLQQLVQQGQGINNPQLWRQVREAENALHHSQFVLARADNARTVYRVRPGDTLAQVGLMFYGDPDQWSQIYDANRHVINDPTRLMPGLSLVVP